VLSDGYDAHWHYLEGTSQELALNSPCNDILYCGTRGPGKTDTQLMRFVRNVGMGYGTYWRGMILDREYKNLDDLVTKSKRWFFPLDNGAEWLAANSAYKWRWPTGEELLFRQVKTVDDYWSYHGHEYPFLGWNELTKYATGNLYDQMLSVNRSGFVPEIHTPRLETVNEVDYQNYLYPNGHYERRAFRIGDYRTHDGYPLPPIPLEVFSTCNPYGPGHNWVKRKFIDPAPYGEPVLTQTTIFNPRTKQEEMITRSQVAIFGNWKENPFLDPVYISNIVNQKDENRRKAWGDGNWDIVAGGAFDDIWDKSKHVIPRFRIPHSWHVDRALDWGSSEPFAVGWFAEANGEEAILPDGSTFCPAPGTLIQIAEIYGADEYGTNVGKKWGAKKLSGEIKDMEDKLIAGGWIRNRPAPGPADNQISNVNETDTDTIEKTFADNGVMWEKSNKSAGSRKNGLELMRERMTATVERDGAGLLFMENCRASIATIPILPRDDKDIDDVDTTAEDHAYDMVRYRVLKGANRTAKIIRVKFPR